MGDENRERPEYFKSQKGTDLLKKDGYLYKKDKDTKNGIIYWRCNYSEAVCSARAQTKDGFLVRADTEKHEHVQDIIDLKKREVFTSIKNKAATTYDTPTVILADEIGNLPSPVKLSLPSSSLIKKSINYKRKKTNNHPKQPQTLADIKIPSQLKLTTNGQNFLLHDSGSHDPNRFFIFGTQKSLDILSSCKIQYCDGTFKVAPQLIEQVFTFAGYLDGFFIPCVYLLLPNKKEATYDVAHRTIRTLAIQNDPDYIYLDFEKGNENVLRKIYPRSKLKGCYTHLCRCCFRKFQSFPDILHFYLNDPIWQLHLKFFPAMAFIPAADIVAKYTELLNLPFFQDNYNILEPFLEYFQNTWIGKLRVDGSRSSPLFAIEMWSHHDSVVDDRDRTNNRIEGYHHKLNALIGCTNPTIFKFIEGLKKQEVTAMQEHYGLLAGQPPTKRRRKYRNVNSAVKSIVENYQNRSLESYLSGLATYVTYRK